LLLRKDYIVINIGMKIWQVNAFSANLLHRNFLPKSFGIPVCLIDIIGTEILRDPDLFNWYYRDNKCS